MEVQNSLEIMDILEKMKQHALFQEYAQVYKEILINDSYLEYIDLYRLSQEAYTSFSGYQKEIALEELKANKRMIDDTPLLKRYFQLARQIEFFLDDLNYTINKEITTAKQSCHA